MKAFLKEWWPLALVFLVVTLIGARCDAEEFIADFSDKPGMNYGTMTLEAGVWGLAAWGGKALFDKTKEGRKIDFIPAVAISLVTIFWHIPMYRQGQQELGQALQQDVFECGGAWLPVVFNF